MDKYLKNLLEKNIFDFSKSLEEFEKIFVPTDKNLPQIEITEDDLRKRWKIIKNEKFESFDDNNIQNEQPYVPVNIQTNFVNDNAGNKVVTLSEVNTTATVSQFDELE